METPVSAHISEEVEAAAQALALHFRRARSAVVLTGAGMSTECGIPDFRSPGSPWLANPPMPFDHFIASEEARLEAWRRKFALDHKGAVPGAGHKALARLVSEDIVATVITQNIDNMHQNAGIAAEQVIELHGNGTYARCLECARRHDLAYCRQVIETERRAPRCEACGGIVKSATISFGQAMPQEEMRKATMAARGADLMLVIGSSLIVYPAAGLPLLARDNGATFLILNRGETGLDDEASEHFDADAGAVLSRLATLLARKVN